MDLISASSVIERHMFDGAVIDKGLHNQAFDLCTELQLLDVSYITCNARLTVFKSRPLNNAIPKAAANPMTAIRAQRCGLRDACKHDKGQQHVPGLAALSDERKLHLANLARNDL